MSYKRPGPDQFNDEPLTDNETILRLLCSGNSWSYDHNGHEISTFRDHARPDVKINTWYSNCDFAGVDHYVITIEKLRELEEQRWIEGVPRMGYVDRYTWRISRAGIEEVRRLDRIADNRRRSEYQRLQPDHYVDALEIEDES